MHLKELELNTLHNVGGCQLIGIDAIVLHKGMELRFPLSSESRRTIEECVERDFDKAIERMGNDS